MSPRRSNWFTLFLLLFCFQLPTHARTNTSEASDPTTTSRQTTVPEDTFTSSSDTISVHIGWIIGVAVVFCLCTACLLSLIAYQGYYVWRTKKQLTAKMQDMTVQLHKFKSLHSPSSPIELVFRDSNQEESPRVPVIPHSPMANRSQSLRDDVPRSKLSPISRRPLQRSVTDLTDTVSTSPYGVPQGTRPVGALSIKTYSAASNSASPPQNGLNRGANGTAIHFHQSHHHHHHPHPQHSGGRNVSTLAPMTPQPRSANHGHRPLKARSKTYGNFVPQRPVPHPTMRALGMNGNHIHNLNMLQPQRPAIPATPLSTTSTAGLGPVPLTQSPPCPHPLALHPAMPRLTKSRSDPEEQRRSSIFRGAQKQGFLLRPTDIQLPRAPWRGSSNSGDLSANGPQHPMQPQVSFAPSSPHSIPPQSMTGFLSVDPTASHQPLNTQSASDEDGDGNRDGDGDGNGDESRSESSSEGDSESSSGQYSEEEEEKVVAPQRATDGLSGGRMRSETAVSSTRVSILTDVTESVFGDGQSDAFFRMQPSGMDNAIPEYEASSVDGALSTKL